MKTINIRSKTVVVITEQSEIANAPTEVLIATIFALTGTEPTPDASRAIVERRAAHEIMVAEDARNHRGVPKWGPPPDISFSGLVDNLCKANATHDAMTGRTLAPQPTVVGYRATGKGTSKVQAGSVRGAVLRWITAQPDSTATLAQAEAHFKHPCNGHIQKLLAASHLERVALS